jgi:SAM-dependent methyltransferase
MTGQNTRITEIKSPPIPLACPECKTLLAPAGPDELVCPQDGHSYIRQKGVWRCLPPERADRFQAFLQDYEAIRLAEGRGSADPEYYRALPFADLSGKLSADWRLRARSYSTFLDRILAPVERGGRRLKILDLGAGNAWLSYRMALRGHLPAAVDLRTGSLDGLGAICQYDPPLLAVQADFDCLPFLPGTFDLVIYNASLHYSTGYRASLQEALRVLDLAGQLVVLDTPLYHQPASGQAMVREREAAFQRQYGFASNALPSENFLTPQQLSRLSRDLHIRWRAYHPSLGLGWAARPWAARLRRQRETASFPVLVARRS